MLKTPVPLQQLPSQLQAVIGYEFFKVDPESGRVREMDEMFGPAAERDFWLRLDDLAHDITGLLQLLDTSPGTEPPIDRGTVYVAETTSDLREQRDAIKRDLQQHGYTVLPARPLPLSMEEAGAAIREDLALSRMSVHMIGRHYGLVPRGRGEVAVELQNELAIERGRGRRCSASSGSRKSSSATTSASCKCIEHLQTDSGSSRAPTSSRPPSRSSRHGHDTAARSRRRRRQDAPITRRRRARTGTSRGSI